MPPRTYRKIPCITCGKEYLQTHIRRHELSCNGEKLKARGSTESGKNFFCTWNEPVKYKIAMMKNDSWLAGITIANEWGVSRQHGHCHAVITTKEKMKYEEVKKKLGKKAPNDIEGCKRLRDALKYVTKEDYRAYTKGHNLDHFSLVWKAYYHSQREHTIRYTQYPYVNLIPTQKKDYVRMFEEFVDDETEETTVSKWDNFTLYSWQTEATEMLLDQGPRTIHWIYDPEGNKGKTELCNYLSQYYSAIVLSDGKSQDIAHCYGNEKLVLFDYTRDNEECINYNVLEGFKNGRLWSPKYDSSVKVFLPPKVMCFANFLPRLSGLSMDRWNIYDLDDKDNALLQHDRQRN